MATRKRAPARTTKVNPQAFSSIDSETHQGVMVHVYRSAYGDERDAREGSRGHLMQRGKTHHCLSVTQYEWHAHARVEIVRDTVTIDVDAPTRLACRKAIDAALIDVCARWRSRAAIRTTFRCGTADAYYVIVFVGDAAPTVARYAEFAAAYAASTKAPT